MARVPAARESGPVPGAEPLRAPAAPLGERLVGRGLISPNAIPSLLDCQKRWGCRFGEATIAQGAITPVELAETLADGFGLPFVDLIAEPPDASLLDPAQIDLYLRELMLPWRNLGGAPVIACADPSPQIQVLVSRLYGPRALLAVTGKFDIIWTVQRMFREALSRDASLHLHDRAPQLSARKVTTAAQRRLGAGLALIVAASLFAAPTPALAFLLILLSVCYGANIVLRVLLFGAAGTRATGYRVPAEELAALAEPELPRYSIVAPLYREAHMVGPLAEALKRLDYPAAKLDVKLVLEEDDAETIGAAKALRLDGRFEILCVPASSLRTKPRACNYALRFVRGEYVVVYDAEDRPEPDQLKKVVAAFGAAGPGVACFQARLNVYNACDNWLTRGIMAQTPPGPGDDPS